MSSVHISANERAIMERALGRRPEDAIERCRHRKPDYRNAFVCGPDSEDWSPIQKLVEIGFMQVRIVRSEMRGGMSVFSVTQDGIGWLDSHGSIDQHG